jgi:hypothetical protein
MNARGMMMLAAPISDLAEKRNAQSVDQTVAKLSSMLRELCSREPHRGHELLVEKALSNLGRLRAKVREANAVVSDVERERGSLDLLTVKAETAAARMLLDTIPPLEMMYVAAQKADNTYPLKCLVIATEILAGSVEDDLFRRTRYPDSEPDLKRALAVSKIARVHDIQSSVIVALDGTNDALGIVFPDMVES